jgi:hypothetical protein
MFLYRQVLCNTEYTGVTTRIRAALRKQADLQCNVRQIASADFCHGQLYFLRATIAFNRIGRVRLLTYQIGFARSKPHSAPRSNAFGNRVGEIYEQPWLGELLTPTIFRRGRLNRAE